MHVSLHHFLRTGCLGDVRIGMTEAQVRGIVGEPDDVGGTSRRYPRPSIYLYGTVELWFGKHNPYELTGIYWDAGEKGEFRLPNRHSVADWELMPEMKRASVEVFLRNAGIAFSRTESGAVDEIVMASGVRIGFDESGCLSAVWNTA